MGKEISLKLDASLIPDILSGLKELAIIYGTLDFEDQITIDGHWVQVESVKYYSFCDLPLDALVEDGHTTFNDALVYMKKFYPDIQYNDTMTVVKFHLLKYSEQPTIVCLCGSTRFYETFQEANYLETMKGKIVLSVGFFMHSSNKAHGETIGITPEQKTQLDQLHMRKIDLADEVLILNVGGYIGESTQRELDYAKCQCKIIRYWEKV